MSQPARALIVDDDHTMAQTLSAILTLKGYKNEIAHSAAEALDQFEQTRFCCMLSDIRMPDRDGIALYREIRGRQIDIPVILMTAYAESGLIAQALSEGVVAVLDKPLDFEKLFDLLAALDGACARSPCQSPANS